MQEQFKTMLDMQDRMNVKVHADWIDQNFEWYRALWLECGELIEHYGYKWWKKQTPDMEQVRLEVVDIWHFGMSMLFDGRSTDQIAADMVNELQAGQIEELGVLEAAEALACETLSSRKFSVCHFASLMQASGMDFNHLYEAYVGKNVLNFFRQDHGYKDGSYVKLWDGREDNEHLVEILEGLDKSAADFATQLYDALEERYTALTA